MAKNNPVGWFEIYVQDISRAKKFYEAVFESNLQRLETELEMWAFPMDMERYGAGGALVYMPGCLSGAGGTLVYFSCEDCAFEESRVLTNGGSVEKTKFSIGQYGFISLVRDTEGNMIGLHSLN